MNSTQPDPGQRLNREQTSLVRYLDLRTFFGRTSQYLPRKGHLLALLVFTLAPFLFHYKGDLRSNLLVTGDGILDGVSTVAAAKNFSLWNPFINSGAPALVFPHHQPLYLPVLAASKLFPPFVAFNVLLLLHFAAAGFFTWLYLGLLSLDPVARMAGGLIFIFSGFLSAHADHHYMIHVAAWLPLALWFVEKNFQNKRQRHLVGAACALALSFYAGHTQIALYNSMIVFAYLTFRSLTPSSDSSSRRWISWLWKSAVVFGGVAALSAPQILPIIESLPLINREKLTWEIASTGSWPLYAPMIFLFYPALLGMLGSTLYNQQYYGPSYPSEMVAYLGLLPLFFALSACWRFRKNDRIITFWCVTALVAVLLAFGKHNPLYFLTMHVPGYNMFRIPARNLYTFTFAVAVLSAVGIHWLRAAGSIAGRFPHRWMVFAGAALLTVLMGTVFLLISAVRGVAPYLSRETLAAMPSFFEENYSSLDAATSLDLFVANSGMGSPEIFVPLITACVSVIILLSIPYLTRRTAFWYLVVLLISIDLFMHGHFFTNRPEDLTFLRETSQNPVAHLARTAADQAGNRGAAHRLLALDDHATRHLWPKTNLLFDVSVPNNYGPILFKDYADLTNFHVSGWNSSLEWHLRRNVVLSSLSVRFLITEQREYINLLDSLWIGDPPEARKSPAWTGTRWQTTNAVAQPGGTFILAVETGGPPSIVWREVKLRSRTNYLVTFEARRLLHEDDSVMVADFVKGPEYDNYQQERHVALRDMRDTFKPYKFMVNSGPNAPAEAAFRLFTTTRARLEVRNVSVAEIHGYRLAETRAGAPHTPSPAYRRAGLDGKAVIFENLLAHNRARLVPCIIPATDFRQAKNILQFDADFDSSRCVTVEAFDMPAPSAAGEVMNADYTNPDHLRLRVRTAGRSMLVLSDMYYPGWTATIGDKATKIYKVNGILKGVIVPGAGTWDIALQYTSRQFFLGIALATAYLLVAVGGYTWMMRRRREIS